MPSRRQYAAIRSIMARSASLAECPLRSDRPKDWSFPFAAIESSPRLTPGLQAGENSGPDPSNADPVVRVLRLRPRGGGSGPVLRCFPRAPRPEPAARQAGNSWTDIGTAAGISRQSAHER
jgi:hypothetical protein